MFYRSCQTYSFYRAANAIFAEVGRFVSEEVILELILKNVYQSLLIDWRCVNCLKEYCSLLILQLIVSR